VQLTGTDHATVHNVTEIANKASGDTGVVLTVRPGFSVEINMLARNNEHDSLGLIFLSTGTALSASAFICEDNTSDSGVCIYAEGSAYVGVSDSSFKRNHAGSKGGAIYFLADKVLEVNFWISISTFESNEAQYGGAVSLSSAVSGSTISFTLEGTQFLGNKGSSQDSAVNVEDNVCFRNAEVTECSFDGNSSPTGTLFLKHHWAISPCRTLLS